MGTTKPAPGVAPDLDRYVEDLTGATPHPAKPEPVEVRVIEAVRVEDQQPRTIVTDQVTLIDGAAAVRIAPALRTRARLTLQSNGTVVVGKAGVTAGTGYSHAGVTNLMPPLVIESTDEVWALCSGAGNQTVSILAEIREG